MRRPTLGALNVLNVRLPTGESTNEKTDSNRLGVEFVDELPLQEFTGV